VGPTLGIVYFGSTFRPTYCSPSSPVSVRYCGVPSLLAPPVVFGAGRPPSLVLLVPLLGVTGRGLPGAWLGLRGSYV
jgi:hypothetical protein